MKLQPLLPGLLLPGTVAVLVAQPAWAGCVATPGGSLVQVAFVLSDRYLLHEFQTSIQVASFPPRNHPTQRAMVLPLLVELPGFGGDDAKDAVLR